AGDRAPMCQGLALIPGQQFLGSGEAAFLPDKGARWVDIHYVPPGHFLDSDRRDRYLLSVRHTAFRYGLPELSPHGVDAQYDFSLAPSVRPGGEELSLADRQLLRVGNAVGWSMLSTAFRCRSLWAPYREAFLDFLESKTSFPDLPPKRKLASYVTEVCDRLHTPPTRQDKLANLLIFGGERSWASDVLGRRDWFPTPQLGFAEADRVRLFDAVTVQNLSNGGPQRVLPESLLVHLADEVARDGRGVPFRTPFKGVYDAIEPVRKDREDLHYLHWFRTNRGYRHLRSSREMEMMLEPGAKV